MNLFMERTKYICEKQGSLFKEIVCPPWFENAPLGEAKGGGTGPSLEQKACSTLTSRQMKDIGKQNN